MNIADHNSKDQLVLDIDGLPTPSGTTDLTKAIVAMHDMFRKEARFINKAAHPDVRFVGIIITDGMNSDETPAGFKALETAAHNAHADGIYTISIGRNMF